MHTYLRSIGFSEIKKKVQLDKILREVTENYDERTIIEGEERRLFGCMSKDFGCNMGLMVFGEYDDEDNFEMEYYFPYMRGTGVTSTEDMIIERHAGTQSYVGACEDSRLCVTLIFYLSNPGEYMQELGKREMPEKQGSLTVSALAREGKILFPVKKAEALERRLNNTERTKLISAAKNGSEEAIDSLTMDDIDIYTMISRRIQHEDVFSIVETYFMPYGAECDQYNLMGEILECSEYKNVMTGEKIYQMNIFCNDLVFDVCINEKDLVGVPQTGRRFKGLVWLQGEVNFNG